MGEEFELIARFLEDRLPRVAVTSLGCRHTLESYPVCEYDVITAADRAQPSFTRVRVQSRFLDIMEYPQATLLNTTDPLLRLSLRESRPVADPSWTISSVKATLSAAPPQDDFKRLAEDRLIASLLRIARHEEALEDGELASAGLWLVSAALLLCEGAVAKSGEIPRPSHLVAQLRKVATALPPGLFEAWSDAISSDLVTNTAVVRRLEALSAVYEVLEKASKAGWGRLQAMLGPVADSSLNKELAEARTRFMLSRHLLMDAYAYLAFETVRSMEALFAASYQHRRAPPRFAKIVPELISSEAVGLGLKEHVLSGLGLNVDAELLRTRGQALKVAVMNLLQTLESI